VSAILATGVVVMALYGLLSTAPMSAKARRWSRPGVLVVTALLIVIAVPLAVSSVRIARSAVVLCARRTGSGLCWAWTGWQASSR
jgi:hypothetical protein